MRSTKFLVCFLFAVLSAVLLQSQCASAALTTCSVYGRPDKPYVASAGSVCPTYTVNSLNTTTCVSYKAVWPLGKSCSVQGDCGGNIPEIAALFGCYAGSCGYANRQPGEPCAEDTQCLLGKCDTAGTKTCLPLEDGATCLFGGCSSKSLCLQSSLFPTCQAPSTVDAGGVCSIGTVLQNVDASQPNAVKIVSNCKAGLVCKLGDSGMKCSATGAVEGDGCASASSCVKTDGTAMYCNPTSKTCTAKLAAVGDVCVSEGISTSCVANAACDSLATMKCVASRTVAAGGSCTGDIFCQQGLYCKDATVFTAGKCTAPSACSQDSDCGAAGAVCVCKDGDSTKGGMCAPVGTFSLDAATALTQCIIQSCNGNVLAAATGYPFDKDSCRYKCVQAYGNVAVQGINALKAVDSGYAIGAAPGFNSAQSVQASVIVLLSAMLAVLAVAL